LYRRLAGQGREGALAALAAGTESPEKPVGSDPRLPGFDPRRLRDLLADFLGKQKRGLLMRPLG
jgi:hypothetical protein